MVQHLPRLMLAVMLLSIVSIGVAVKTTRASADFAEEAYAGSTFQRL